MEEVIYKDYETFNVLGEEVILITDKTDYGDNSVVLIKDNSYYLGDEAATLENVLYAWQELNGRDLTVDEIDQITKDNPNSGLI